MKKILILTCAALMATATFANIRATSHDNYGGRGWQIDRHNEKMKVVKNGGAKVVFVGDSITHNWESNGKE